MASDKVVFFNGVKYVLPPSGRYYKSGQTGHKNEFLHRAVWEFHSGQKIPKGYLVHHKDHNKHNNSYENLECLSPKQHSEIHLKGKKPDAHRQKILEKMRENSHKYFQTPEGKKRRTEIATKSFNANKKINCSICKENLWPLDLSSIYAAQNAAVSIQMPGALTECENSHYSNLFAYSAIANLPPKLDLQKKQLKDLLSSVRQKIWTCNTFTA